MNDEALIRIRTSFAALAARPSESIPLAEGALLIAAEEYPDLDIGAYLSRIDTMADDVREPVDNAPDPRAAGTVLTRFLYDVEGFQGNADDYYDPRNSFLNEVMDRRRGIPISLSILYLEVAQRLGLAVHGIGLPGHFLVRLADTGTYVDPFSGQVDLRASDCAERVRALHGDDVKFDRSMLSTQSNRQILSRVLGNLLQIYRSCQDLQRALAALDRIVLLNPESAHVYRERAGLLGEMGQYHRALRDAEKYRQLHPGGRRGERFRSWRRFLREMAARMN
jgi:regulator of sirC expression with transglutaminase-like and TPR domain